MNKTAFFSPSAIGAAPNCPVPIFNFHRRLLLSVYCDILTRSCFVSLYLSVFQALFGLKLSLVLLTLCISLTLGQSLSIANVLGASSTSLIEWYLRTYSSFWRLDFSKSVSIISPLSASYF